MSAIIAKIQCGELKICETVREQDIYLTNQGDIDRGRFSGRFEELRNTCEKVRRKDGRARMQGKLWYVNLLSLFICIYTIVRRRRVGVITFCQSGLAFSSVADGSQMIYDSKFCDSVADLLVNLGQFWQFGHVWKPGLAFSSVADGSQMIYDSKFCDSVADLLVNFGQFWQFGHVWKPVADIYNPSTTKLNPNPG